MLLELKMVEEKDVTTATSLLSFRRKLKTHIFRQSYPDIVV